jgi:hypothetical protein
MLLQKLKDHLHLAVLIVGGLSFIAAVLPRAARADEPATDVNIVSPLPVPVTGTLSVTPVLPALTFTISPSQIFGAPSGSTSQTPDPSGTRYAITSVTVTNNSAATGDVQLGAEAFSSVASNCQGIVNETAHADGPRLTAGAHATASLTFPIPYITSAVRAIGSPTGLWKGASYDE